MLLAEHSAEGHAQTMFNLQLKRPTLWEMEDELKRFSVPLLVVVGDEDEPCIDGSVFLKRTVPTAGLLVVPAPATTSAPRSRLSLMPHLPICSPRRKRAAGSHTNNKRPGMENSRWT